MIQNGNLINYALNFLKNKLPLREASLLLLNYLLESCCLGHFEDLTPPRAFTEIFLIAFKRDPNALF